MPDLILDDKPPFKPKPSSAPLKTARKKKQTTDADYDPKVSRKTVLRTCKKTAAKKDLSKDLYKRRPDVMYCCKCTETFNDEQELLGHFNYFHYESIVTDYEPLPGDEKKSPCHLCKAMITDLRKHTRRRHYTQHVKRAVNCHCRVCGRQFNCYSARRNCEVRHQEEKEKKIYTCDKCDHTFKSQYQWRHHRKHGHKEKPQYNCELCGEVMGSLKKFEFHMLKHTRIYYCDVCQKPFKRKDELQVHLLRHFSRRDHQCHLCSKAFICATGRLVGWHLFSTTLNFRLVLL
jgi:Zinc finger, C2H2 type